MDDHPSTCFIVRDTRAYACSSNTNGGRHLCDDEIRANCDVAEGASLANIKDRLLRDDFVEYVTEQFSDVLHDIESRPNDSDILANKLNAIDARLAKVADAIEAVGVSDTLAERLSKLEQAREENEAALKQVPAPVTFLPEFVPTLVKRWQELVLTVETLALNPVATRAQAERRNPVVASGPKRKKPHRSEASRRAAHQ